MQNVRYDVRRVPDPTLLIFTTKIQHPECLPQQWQYFSPSFTFASVDLAITDSAYGGFKVHIWTFTVIFAMTLQNEKSYAENCKVKCNI